MKEFTSKQTILSLVLKTIVFLSAIIGTYLSAYAGRAFFMGGSRVFMYFTIQSNIAIALLCAIGGVLMLKKKVSLVWFIIKFVGTVSITLTGAVFCFVLAPTMGRYAWNVQNVLTHVVVPIVAICDFFVTGVNGTIEKKSVIFVVLPPLAYAVYAGIGFLCNWQFAEGANYPYFFLNWGSEAGALGFTNELPFMGCVWWILALFGLLIGVGFSYLAIINKLKKSLQK